MSKYIKRQEMKNCNSCKKDFIGRPNQKYCSINCQQKLYRGQNYKSQYNLNTGTTGAIQELRVSVDLMIKGFEVFRALSPACSCDILAMKNKKLYPIEVRTGYNLRSGRLTFPKNKRQEVQFYAIATKKQIHYLPELI